MSKADAQIDFDDVSEFEDFRPVVARAVSNIAEVVNGNLDFSNFRGQEVEVTFPASANTELRVAHRLGKKISRYFVVSKDRACDVYDGVTEANSNSIYLKCTVASATVKLQLLGF